MRDVERVKSKRGCEAGEQTTLQDAFAFGVLVIKKKSWCENKRMTLHQIQGLKCARVVDKERKF